MIDHTTALYCITADLLKATGHTDDVRCALTDAEVITTALEDEIRRLERMAGELEARVAAKGYVAETATQFAEMCKAYREGLLRDDDITFERKCDALLALRVRVLASSKRRPVLQTNLGALIELAEGVAGAVLRPATSARAQFSARDLVLTLHL